MGNFGEKFSNRKDLERALKKLKKNKIKKTRDRKEIAEIFKESIINERFDSKSIFEENRHKIWLKQHLGSPLDLLLRILHKKIVRII